MLIGAWGNLLTREKYDDVIFPRLKYTHTIFTC